MREFVFAHDLGLITCMRDLSATFGRFDPKTCGYKRSIQHPHGHICTLLERADLADDEGSRILWGGAVAAALLLVGSTAFEQQPSQPPVPLRSTSSSMAHKVPTHDMGVVLAVQAALARGATAGGGLLELGAGHGLPTALAALSGAVAMATELPDNVHTLRGSLDQMVPPQSAAGIAVAWPLPWGDAAAAAAAVTEMVACNADLHCIIGCDVLYKPHHAKLLAETVALLCKACADQQAALPDVVFCIDPDCVPGCASLFDCLYEELLSVVGDTHTVQAGACSDSPGEPGCGVLLLCASALR